MDRIDRSHAQLNLEQKMVLQNLLQWLGVIGSANDAEDHGQRVSAESMRGSACQTIRMMLREHSFLAEILPTLQWELDTKHILDFGWVNLYHAVEDLLVDEIVP